LPHASSNTHAEFLSSVFSLPDCDAWIKVSCFVLWWSQILLVLDKTWLHLGCVEYVWLQWLPYNRFCGHGKRHHRYHKAGIWMDQWIHVASNGLESLALHNLPSPPCGFYTPGLIPWASLCKSLLDSRITILRYKRTAYCILFWACPLLDSNRIQRSINPEPCPSCESEHWIANSKKQTQSIRAHYCTPDHGYFSKKFVCLWISWWQALGQFWDCWPSALSSWWPCQPTVLVSSQEVFRIRKLVWCTVRF
jgi:hypothetical protein